MPDPDQGASKSSTSSRLVSRVSGVEAGLLSPHIPAVRDPSAFLPSACSDLGNTAPSPAPWRRLPATAPSATPALRQEPHLNSLEPHRKATRSVQTAKCPRSEAAESGRCHQQL